MRTRRRWLIGTVFFVLILFSCSTKGALLKTRLETDTEVSKATYFVILYGRETNQDVETVAVLDPDNDEFQLVAPHSRNNQTIYKNAGAEEAYKIATDFLGGLIISDRIEKRSILGPEGQVIGYELRPLFNESVRCDCLSTTYWLQDNNKVEFYVNWTQSPKPFSGIDDRSR